MKSEVYRVLFRTTMKPEVYGVLLRINNDIRGLHDFVSKKHCEIRGLLSWDFAFEGVLCAGFV